MEKIKNVEGIIVKTIAKYKMEYPCLEFDDLYQQSCLICLTLEDSHDSNKAKWSTYIQSQLPGRLLRYIKKQIYNSASFNNLNTSLPNTKEDDTRNPEEMIPDERCNQAHLYEVFDTISSMSEDAQKICLEVISPSNHICWHENIQRTRREIRRELKNWLRSNGWSWPRIWRSFHEIRDAMS